MRVLAIDPGNVESAYAVIDSETCQPIAFAKTDNAEIRRAIRAGNFFDCEEAHIEMVASYGMAVGREVFETCVWVGRFAESVGIARPGIDVELVYRRDVKLHHCGQSKAKDSNITQALIDRFAPGQSNRGKGTKAEPGFFHGFRADIWQAYALAVLAADRMHGRRGVA